VYSLIIMTVESVVILMHDTMVNNTTVDNKHDITFTSL